MCIVLGNPPENSVFRTRLRWAKDIFPNIQIMSGTTGPTCQVVVDASMRAYVRWSTRLNPVEEQIAIWNTTPQLVLRDDNTVLHNSHPSCLRAK